MIWFSCNQREVQEQVKFFGLIFPGLRIAELTQLDTTKFIDLFTKTSQCNILLASKTAMEGENKDEENEERKKALFCFHLHNYHSIRNILSRTYYWIKQKKIIIFK